MVLDNDLKEILGKIVSMLLPHDNYDGACFNTILTETFKLVRLEEMDMEYYVLFHVLNNVSKVKLPFHHASLTRDAFKDVISNFILNEANSEKLRLKEYLLFNGEATDLTNVGNKERAMNILFTLSLRLYDTAFEAAIPSAEYPAFILNLREAVMNTLAYDCINAQGDALRDGYKTGRKFYSGPYDWLQLVKNQITNIESRLPDDTSDSSVTLDDPSKGRALLEEQQSKGMQIAPYGLPPMDDMTPISKNRLVILAGNPNVGKTSVMLAMVMQIIEAGGKVVILSGESSPGKIYVQLLSSYIKRKYGISIPPSMLSNMDKCSDEVIRLIHLYQSEFSSLNQLVIQEQFSYSTFYDQAASLREKFEYDAIFVDHTLSMANLTDQYQCLEQLAIQARNFKNKYPVFVCLLSHLSTETQKELKEGRSLEAPCTKHNATLESEADEVLVLTTNPEFRKQKKLGVINKKRRDAEVVTDLMVVRMDFQFKVLSYHDEDQIGNAVDYMQAESAIENLKGLYGVNDEDDELDLD